jgi:quercetin dioxygenase-like cupin family protein
MIEEVYTYALGDQKAVDRLIEDDNIQYIHVVFGPRDGFPLHESNSNVYMTVVRGRLSIGLGDEKIHAYEAGSVLKIPYKTKMNVRNEEKGPLELIIVKAPAPSKMI